MNHAPDKYDMPLVVLDTMIHVNPCLLKTVLKPGGSEMSSLDNYAAFFISSVLIIFSVRRGTCAIGLVFQRE